MRVAFALLAAGIAVGAARGEPVRRTATVEVDGVEVRAGHASASRLSASSRRATP